MHTYHLLLGSNVGNKTNHLESALSLIDQQIGQVVERSSLYETEPWGLENQDNFINQAVKVISDKSPQKVLDIIKEIELKIGRTVTEHWGPRVIDIDILYCDDMVMDAENIKIPHPQISNRNFVLVPLIEIAGDMMDPVLQITIDEIYEKCTDTCEVYLYENENQNSII